MQAIIVNPDREAVAEFERQEALARKTKNEVLIAFVVAVKEILVAPVNQLNGDMVKNAFSVIVEIFENIPMENPRFRFFWNHSNRLTSILNGDLRWGIQNAMITKEWSEVQRQRQNIHHIINEMVHSYK